MNVGVWHHTPVPARKYGGTERIVHWLAGALAERGHDVALLTPPGSRSDGAEVVAVPEDVVERAELDGDLDLDRWLPSGLEVLHFHCPVAASTRLPRVTTVHGNSLPRPPAPRHVFVSRNHMERMGGRHFVHNAVPVDEFEFRSEKEDWFLFLSKARWKVKGVDRAERIARRAGIQLVIAGGWRFNWSWRISSVGMVGDERKRRLLSGARALLFPVRWEEPFGLVVAEALASGTPVIASRRGSLPELVTPEVGFLCQGEDEFVEAVGRVGEIDPAACRRRARERFDTDRMAADYLELYRRAVDGRLEEPFGTGDEAGRDVGGPARPPTSRERDA